MNDQMSADHAIVWQRFTIPLPVYHLLTQINEKWGFMVDEVQSDEHSGGLTLELWFNKSAADEPWSTGHVVVRDVGSSHRVRFDARLSIEDTFQPQLVDFLTPRLGDSVSTSVLLDKELELLLPGVSLKGFRLLTWLYPDGRMSASLRFLDVQGFAFSVFKEKARPGPVQGAALDRAALQALDDLLLPALEIYDEIVERGFSDAGTPFLLARLKTMKMKRDELSIAVDALQSVFGKDTDPGVSGRGVAWSPETGIERGVDMDVLSGHWTALDDRGLALTKRN